MMSSVGLGGGGRTYGGCEGRVKKAKWGWGVHSRSLLGG